jgi:hypothetical protein
MIPWIVLPINLISLVMHGRPREKYGECPGHQQFPLQKMLVAMASVS